MVSQKKQDLRKAILAKRNLLTEEECKSKSNDIVKSLFQIKQFQSAKCIALYLPTGNEVITNQIIEKCISVGKEVLVPVTNAHIEFFRFNSFEDLTPGKYGIPEPKLRNSPKCDPDVILVPGIVFGFCMHRIGYGKGYYDRYLRGHKAYRIGICYDFQILNELPKHEDDQHMDLIITDKRTIPQENDK